MGFAFFLAFMSGYGVDAPTNNIEYCQLQKEATALNVRICELRQEQDNLWHLSDCEGPTGEKNALKQNYSNYQHQAHILLDEEHECIKRLRTVRRRLRKINIEQQRQEYNSMRERAIREDNNLSTSK